MKTEFKGYAKIINEATGETDAGRIAHIEECMRFDIFHSTLDWQTAEQLKSAARAAQRIVNSLTF